MTHIPARYPSLPVLLAAAFLAGLSARAQSVPAPSTADKSAGETIVLSEFRVDTTKDRGYRATNSISGTRLNTAIKDLPMPVEVITEEFIQDIGALDVREALAFSSGVVLEAGFDEGRNNDFSADDSARSFDFSPSNSGGRLSSDQYKLRGFTTNVTLRNGFSSQGNLDSADLGRVEVVRGPAALLYGTSILGGVVNAIPKYPLATARYSFGATVGSQDLYRFQYDLTGPLLKVGGKQINYRLPGSFQRRGDWREFNDSEIVFLAPKLELKPFVGTNIFLDLRYQKSRIEGNGFQDFRYEALPRDEFNRFPGIARELNGRDNRFRWSGPDTFSEDEVQGGLLEVQQKINDHIQLLASGTRQQTHVRQRQIRNLTLQTMAPTATTIPAAYRSPRLSRDAGFEALRYEWNDEPRAIYNESARVEANLKYDFNLPLIGASSHNLLLGRQDSKVTTSTHSRVRAAGQDFSWKRTDDLSYFRFTGEASEPSLDGTDERWQTGHYGVYQGKFFKERLQLIGGLRYDRYMVRALQYQYLNGVRRQEPRGALATDSAEEQRQYSTGKKAAELGLPGARTNDSAPRIAGYRFNGETQYDSTPTAGVSFRITDEVSIYGVSTGGLYPNPGQRDGGGNPFDAELTQSKELGLKVDLLEGRVSGTLSFFEVERENAIYFYQYAPSPRNNRTQPGGGGFEPRQPRTYAVRSQFFPAGFQGTPASAAGYFLVNYETLSSNPVARAALDAAFRDGTTIDPILYGDASSNNPSRSQGSDTAFSDRSKGFDAQLILSLTRNWQVTLNYALVEREVTKGFSLVDHEDISDGRNYGTEYDVWVQQLGRDSFSDPTRAGTFDGGVLLGENLDDSPKHSASVWSNFSFTEGRLDGLSLRGGVIYTGKRQTAVNVGRGNLQRNNIKTPDAPERYEVRVGAGYRTKLLGRTWNFQLNVNNLLDDRKDESRASFANPAAGAPLQRRFFSYFAPREIRLSSSVTF